MPRARARARGQGVRVKGKGQGWTWDMGKSNKGKNGQGGLEGGLLPASSLQNAMPPLPLLLAAMVAWA